MKKKNKNKIRLNINAKSKTKMVRKLFGFKQQLWGKKKQETPNVTVLKYVQYSEFDDTKYGTVQFDSNTTNNNNNNGTLLID